MTSREEYHAEMQALREAPKPKPFRLNYSELLALALTRTPSRETIDLERGMRGEVKIAVSGVCREGESLSELRGRLADVFDGLCASYPMASGFVRANGGVE